MAGPESFKGPRPNTAEWAHTLNVVKREHADREAAGLTGGYTPSPEYRGLHPLLRHRAERILTGNTLRAMAHDLSGNRPYSWIQGRFRH